jgi:hypothetical protein
MLIPSINNSLNELIDLLEQMSNTEYSKHPSLSNSTIGNTRHIVEMFQCLENSMTLGLLIMIKGQEIS